MIVRLFAALGLLSCLAAPTLVQSAPRDPAGVWITEDGRARVRIERCGPSSAQVCGFLVWLRGEAAKTAIDRKNPDAKKAGRAILGHQLILGLKPNEDSQFEGRIYNAEDGQTYDVSVWVESRGDLKVKGCLVGFLCSTQTWRKTNDVLPGQLVGATGTPDGPRYDPEWANAKAAPAPARRDKPARS